ncbi:MAG: right-handed parallel beta-helix repeat-containing protein [Myxococcota bacterium]
MHLAALALVWSGAACSTARVADDGGRPPQPTTYFVDAAGDDGAAGDRDHPFHSFAHALSMESIERLVVNPGRFTEDLRVNKRVEIFGPGGGGATLDGAAEIRANDVRLHGVDVSRGLKVSGARGIWIEDATISAGPSVDAIAIESSIGRVDRVFTRGGAETCVLVRGSTLAMTELGVDGAIGGSKRGLRVDSSSVSINGVRGSSAAIALIQVEGGSRVNIRDAVLGPASGVGLTVLRAGVEVHGIRVHDTASGGILLSESTAKLEAIDVSRIPSPSSGLAMSGANVEVSGGTLSEIGGAAITGIGMRGRSFEAKLSQLEIRHGSAQGINISQGSLHLSGSHLVGNPSATRDGEDAITVYGDGASLLMESTEIDGAAGSGITISSNAGGQLSGRITRPRIAGVLISDSAGADIALRDLSVSDAKTGSGIVLQHSQDVNLSNVEVVRCFEAGVLSSLGSHLTVRQSRFLQNRQYGLAAFGTSDIDVGGSSARGSKWATFATCADGSGIIDSGGNTFEGPTTICP